MLNILPMFAVLLKIFLFHKYTSDLYIIHLPLSEYEKYQKYDWIKRIKYFLSYFSFFHYETNDAYAEYDNYKFLLNDFDQSNIRCVLAKQNIEYF